MVDFDVGFRYTEIIGDGVIGLTPEIGTNENFAYFSNVMLRSGSREYERKIPG